MFLKLNKGMQMSSSNLQVLNENRLIFLFILYTRAHIRSPEWAS